MFRFISGLGLQAVNCLKHRLPRLADDLAFPQIGVGVEGSQHLRFDLARQLGRSLGVVVQPMFGPQRAQHIEDGQGAVSHRDAGVLGLGRFLGN